jgi:hypothetical protein
LSKANRHITRYIKKTFPGATLFKSFSGSLIFKIPSTYKVSEIFENMNEMEKKLEIADISISNSSLEDVFMNVVQKFDREHDE